MIRIFIIISTIVLTVYGVFLYQSDLSGTTDPRLTAFYSHCTVDKNKFCKGINIGNGRLFTCLRNNKNKILSPGLLFVKKFFPVAIFAVTIILVAQKE